MYQATRAARVPVPRPRDRTRPGPDSTVPANAATAPDRLEGPSPWSKAGRCPHSPPLTRPPAPPSPAQGQGRDHPVPVLWFGAEIKAFPGSGTLGGDSRGQGQFGACCWPPGPGFRLRAQLARLGAGRDRGCDVGSSGHCLAQAAGRTRSLTHPSLGPAALAGP